MRRLITIASMFISAALAGCGSDNGLELARVRGVVTHEGKPLTYGSIMFEPDTTKGTSGPPAIGTINQDGSFVLSTEDSGDGAVVGAHRVAIIGLDANAAAAEPPPSMPDPEVDPKAFMQAKAKAGMLANRPKKAESQTFTDKTGKVFKITIPAQLANPSTSKLTADIGRGSNSLTIAINEDGSAKISQ